MNKRIVVNGTELDIGSIGFTLTFSISDIQEPALRKAFRSSTITVPATVKNLRAFGHPDIVGVRQVSGFTGQLTVGLFTFWGDVIYYGFEWIGREKYISFQLVSNSLTEKLSGVKLSDLDTSAGDHTITAANINTSPTDYVKYGLFDHGADMKKQDGNCFAVERHAGIHVATLFEKIINHAGYTLSGSINESHYIFDFSKLLINQSNFAEDKAALANCNYQVGKDLVTNVSFSFAENLGFAITGSGAFDKGNNFAANKYTVPKDGAYRAKVNVVVIWNIEGTLTTSLIYKIQIRKNGTMIFEAAMPGTLVEAGQYTFSVDTSFQHLEEGDELDGYITYTGRVANLTTPTIFTSAVGTMTVEADARRGLGYDVEISELLPDVQCLEFIKSYLTLQNMVFRIDENTKVVTVQPFEHFMTANEMNWTSKIVLEEKITVEKLQRPASLAIGYQADDQDTATKSLTNFATKEITFSEYEEDQRSILVPFARTLQASAWRFGVQSWDMPTAIGDKALRFKTRILKDDPVGASWYFEGQYLGTFPRFTEIGLTPDDMAARYSGHIAELTISKVVKATFRLSDFDIHRIVNYVEGYDARAFIRLDVQGMEGLYRIAEIGRWSDEKSEAEVTLIQAATTVTRQEDTDKTDYLETYNEIEIIDYQNERVNI